MATIRLDHLQIATGLEADVDVLRPGELGYSTDLLGLWIGTSTLPVLLCRGSFPPWGRLAGSITLAGAMGGEAVLSDRGALGGNITLDGAITGGMLDGGGLDGSIDLAGAMLGSAVGEGGLDGTIALDGTVAGGALAAGSMFGSIDLDGAVTGEARTGAALAGSITLDGAAGGASTAGGALSGSITLAGAAGGAAVTGGAMAGSITLAGAMGGGSIAAGGLGGSIALDGAMGGDTIWAWDGVTDFCLWDFGTVTEVLSLTGSCSGGVGSWSFSGGCSVTVSVNAGTWTTGFDTGTLVSLSPIVVNFPASAFDSMTCVLLSITGGEMSSDLSNCSGPVPCGENADLTVGGPYAGGYTLPNTATDAWSGSTGTCGAWTITWTGTTYHLSGNGNEIDADHWTCGPTHIYFLAVDISCDGFGTQDMDFYV